MNVPVSLAVWLSMRSPYQGKVKYVRVVQDGDGKDIAELFAMRGFSDEVRSGGHVLCCSAVLVIARFGQLTLHVPRADVERL